MSCILYLYSYGGMVVHYVSLTQRCNYRCCCCPCPHSGEDDDLTLDGIVRIFDNPSDDSKRRVTLSGGEPTIHKEFLPIMKFFAQENYDVTILTNSSLLASNDFLDKLNNCYPINRLHIITTLYSVDPNQHDSETGVSGSFANTIKAVQLLASYGAKVTLKYCISAHNAAQLYTFYHFLENTFDASIQFQICGIDYAGMSHEMARSMQISCAEIRHYLDPLLEEVTRRKLTNGNCRNISIAYLPLCASSPKYWDFFITKGSNLRVSYLSARNYTYERQYNARKGSSLCAGCVVYDECFGTYPSAFRVLGEQYVSPFRNLE